MGHSHSAAGQHRGRLLAVFALSLVTLVAEVVVGLLSGSLALLADAGHLFADVAGTGLALAAIWFASRPPSPERTYGYYRLEILAAVANAVLLLGVALLVLAEAWERVRAPVPVDTLPMLLVALAGLGVNAASLALLRPGQAHSLTIRGAYLEVLSDLLGSVAVVAAALVIRFTGWLAIDPLASALIALAILPRTWTLLREAVDVLLEATPKGIDLEEVRQHILQTPGVTGVHDLHAWTITSGMNVLSAHVVIAPDAQPAAVLDRLWACLEGHFDVGHSTFQIEPYDRFEAERGCHR